ncbi:Protease 4 [bacterium HR30]|nr:Protease 4 [bacterium HR30]
MFRKRRVLFFLVVALAGVALWLYSRRGPYIADGSVLLVNLQGSYPEAPPEGIWAKLLAPRETALAELLLTLRKAGKDARIQGVVARIAGLDIGWAKANDIRDALFALRLAGKRCIALLEDEVGNANLSYYVATGCERVYTAPSAQVALRGLIAHYLFLGGLWEKFHIEIDVEKVAEYKTAGDTLAGKEMSPPHREMANSLLDSINELYLGTVAFSRGLAVERVRSIIQEQGPSGPQQLLDSGLIDGAKHLEDVWLELGVDRDHVVLENTYERVPATAVGLHTGPKVAVILGAGTIVLGESQHTASRSLAGAESLRTALSEASDDPSIRAILLRVDSPGGSALASDIVWRAVEGARRKKPVIASFSDVAASGGYYIASASTRIVAQPGSFTGSIGVVFARPNVRGLLTDWGIHVESITRGRLAYLDDITTPLDAEGRARIREDVERTYELFVQRVSDGRKLEKGQVHDVGRGRVWTGAQAKEIGLVDALGGFYAALDLAKQEAGIPAEQDPELVFLPAAKGWWQTLTEGVDSKLLHEMPRFLRELARAYPKGLPQGPATIMADHFWVQ